MTQVSCQHKDPQPLPGPQEEGITEIYVYGAATVTGKSLHKMESFTNAGDGVFSWTGYLSAGAPFRFPLQKTSDWPCLMVGADGTSIVYGRTEEDLIVYTVAVNGTYAITIDTRNENGLTCSVELARPDLSNVEIKELYILGEATLTGWSLPDMEQFDQPEAGLFTWEGTLLAGKRFRFPLQKVDNGWWPCLCCAEGGVIFYGIYDADESNVPVTEDGRYRITVDTRDRNNVSYAIELVKAGLPGPEIDHLYVLGDAAPGGWALDQMPEFANNGRIFTWTGTLKSSGVFRFNAINSDWFPAIVLEKGTDHAVYVTGWDDALYDQFHVARTDIYTVTVDARQYDAITVSIVKAE